jgi:hypothetical protein
MAAVAFAGGNYLSTLGRTLKAAGRFVIDFF